MNEEEMQLDLSLTGEDPMTPEGQDDFSADEAAAALAFATQMGEQTMIPQEMASTEGETQEAPKESLSDQYPQEEATNEPNEEVEGIRGEIQAIRSEIQEALKADEKVEEPEQNLVTKDDLESFKSELTNTIKKSLE